jgi:superfamily II DNA/RNA helicase
MLYVPLTSDTYVHLSGRTGRGAQGVALTVVCEDEAKKLGLFSSQLGISIRPVQENAEGLVF